MSQQEYAQPDAVVSTEWVAARLDDPSIRIVESNEDVLLYDTGHLPGAVHIDWRADLQDQTVRDYISPAEFAAVCSKNGIGPATTCVFYGDKSNWWACYALWVFRLFGHENVKIMNGGRDKWVAEGRPLTREKPRYQPVDYPVPPMRRDAEIRAFFEDADAQSKAGRPLIDVRSPGEFRGEITHMPEYPQEGVLRGGHVPGAKSVPWKTAVHDDGTFKSREELEKIYTQGSRRRRTSSPIAASVSARATRGSSLPICSATGTCATTTVRGPNGATASARRSHAATEEKAEV
jgi:thiosulfate/3-mercaptopyruvate sulfurtransferase